MIITQLSIKVVDEPGQLGRVSDLLGDEGINIRALTAAVHGDDSRFHIVVDDPAKARVPIVAMTASALDELGRRLFVLGLALAGVGLGVFSFGTLHCNRASHAG